MMVLRSIPGIMAAGFVAFAIVPGAAAADELKPLHIGDNAPAIDIEHWIKGEQVEAFEPGNVYVVEFWATWCGPCRASMPHITKLQDEWKEYDVTIIGVSDEPLNVVVPWLFKETEGKQWNDKIGYTLTTDPDRSVFKDYMYGFGQGGIPTAFIVGKQGKIEWVGHPTSIDQPLEAVIRDSWDRDKFAEENAEQFNQARDKLKEKLALQAKASGHIEAMEKAIDSGNVDVAVAAVDQIIALDERFASYRVKKFQMLVGELNSPQRGYAYGEELLEESWEDPGVLNAVAWYVVDDPAVKTRDLDFALKAAKQASELTNNEDGAILDTLARVYYEKGDLDSAIEWQKKAVEHAGPMKAELEASLEKYEAEAGR